MKRIELERAWPATEPPPGFSDRVLERLQLGAAATEPAPRRANALRWLQVRRVRWLALPALALALATMLLLWPAGPARGGDVIASEPRVVAIGERAVAEMSRGAHLRWSDDPLQKEAPREVRQESGAVTYRVLPGTDFRVRTPHGSVAVLGTVFRVVVADREEARGEPMKKRWAIAGVSAALGALLWVSVEQGSVRLSNDKDELVLGAGQSGTIDPDGIRVAAQSGVTRNASPSMGSSAPPRLRPEAPMQPALRERRQRVLDSLAARPVHATSKTPVVPAPPADGEPGHMSDRTGVMPETVKAINAQFGPLVDQCFDQAQERGVNQRGMLGLGVKLASAEGVGRIIEDIEPTAVNEVDDAELLDCLRESAFTVDLPEEGSGRTDFMMTIPYEPRQVDAGAATGRR